MQKQQCCIEDIVNEDVDYLASRRTLGCNRSRPMRTRAGRSSLEISVTPGYLLDPQRVGEHAALDVDRLIVMPRPELSVPGLLAFVRANSTESVVR
jgi:hypothetical protein